LFPQIRRFHPEMLFYQAGVDALAGDRLGRLALSHQGLLERDRAVFDFTKSLGIPVVITLGGGYTEPIEQTVIAHANTFIAAAEAFPVLRRAP
jgi:acetoin utilization deacetylase AcuC-like enzyme